MTEIRKKRLFSKFQNFLMIITCLKMIIKCKNKCLQQLITSANISYQFLMNLRKLIFVSIFLFFVTKIGKKLSKNRIPIYGYSSIGNLNKSTTRYGIPYLDKYFLSY